MNTLDVVNIKCGGCEAGIMAALSKAGLTSITVSAEKQQVSFEGGVEIAKKILAKMGYPEANSKAAKSWYKKSKSYLSCMIGKTKK
ncbi:MAG: heavy-metal-associated domain-containing protein [Candidatus Komeilibacteria bacterium]